MRRSREGAWIEMPVVNMVIILIGVAPARERGLKYDYHEDFVLMYLVAPARERGLKSSRLVYDKWVNLSLPRGSVD